MQSNVYCDNEMLRDLILDAKPSQGGLYPHELAMIFYASIGQIQYENPGFAGVFRLQLKVDNPVCLLYSLVDRGYIRRSQFEENIRFYGTREMQRFVKERGVKSSSKRGILAEIIRSNFAESEIRSAFLQDYYVPTEKGQTELDVTQYTIMDVYKGWEENKGYYGSLKRSDIKLYCPASTELSISTVDEPWKHSLIVDRHPSNIGARIIRLPKRSNLIISKDGRKVYSVNDVDVIHFLRHHKVLVFENICDPEVSMEFRRRSKVIATVYDIENELPLYTEVIDYTVDQRDVLFSEFIEQNTKPFSKVIKQDGHIDYYSKRHKQLRL